MTDKKPRAEQLQHLQNIISSAKGEPNHFVSILRDVIRLAADEMPEKDVIKCAEWMLQRGIEMEDANDAERN